VSEKQSVKKVSVLSSFRFKLAFLVVGVQLVVLGVAGTFFIQKLSQDTLQSAVSENQSQVQLFRDQIESSLREFGKTMSLMATEKSLGEFDTTAASGYIKSYKVSQLFQAGEMLALYDPNDNIIADNRMTSASGDGLMPQKFPYKGKVNPVRPYISPVVWHNNNSFKIVAVEVTNYARANGSLAASYSLKRLVPVLKGAGSTGKKFSFITDMGGKLVLSGAPQATQLIEKVQALGVPDSLLGFTKEQMEQLLVTFPNGLEYVLNYSASASNGLVVWLATEKRSVDELAARVRDGVLGVMVLMLLISTLVSIWATGRIVAPLRQLTEIMNRATKDGSLNEATGIDREDEIGVLAHGFDQLRESLRDYIQRLADHKLHLEEMVKQRTAALEESNKSLEQISRTDPLTGIANRRDILERIELERVRSDRTGRPFCFIIMDIDKFKSFNDTYGHDCGDFVLKTVAQEISGCLRQCDYVARWGGEEFLVVLPETSLEYAIIVGERIRKRIAETIFAYQEKSLHVTITLGLAEFETAVSPEDSIAKADQALYHGKNSGRNCLVVMNADESVRQREIQGNVFFIAESDEEEME
jgi:diguanylate cyclase (GGDEF)-like protein